MQTALEYLKEFALGVSRKLKTKYIGHTFIIVTL